jgi:hypothetical protein
MSDKKISQLTASTTPLVGTEVLPVVQSGVTKQVSVDNLTAGKTVPALALNVVTGNTGTTIRSTPGLIIRSNGTNTDTNLRFSDTDSFASEVGQQNGEMYFTTAGTEKLRIVSGGNFKINVGNLVIGTAGKGIDFSADPSAAGMTSELLDDYEEGTWTPALTFGGAAAGMAGTFTGSYNKVGNKVYVVGKVALSAKGSSTGAALISGLPFNAVANTESSNVIDPITGMASLTAGGCMFSVVSSALLYPMVQTTSSRTQITDANFTNTSQIVFSAVYLV